MRYQLPVYSPLSPGALLAGAQALRAPAEPALVRATELVAAEWGAETVVLTGSGTAALSLAIRAALGSSSYARVALPAYGCYDLATAADDFAARVLLYDLDPRTLAPDAASLRQAVDAGAAAIVLVHLYGIPVDVDAVRRDFPAAVIIEDAAQGIGGTLRGKPLGAHGDLSVLSFGRGKGVSAGSGGALLLPRAAQHRVEVPDPPRLQPPTGAGKSVAALAAQWVMGRPMLYGIPASLPFLRLGETIYHRPSPPRGMAGAAAAVLPYALVMSKPEAAARRRNAERLLRSAADRAVRPVSGEPGWLRLPLVPDISRRRAADAARALGIMPGYPLPLNRLQGFAERCCNTSRGFPGAEALAEGLVTLPTHSLLNETDLCALERWLTSAG